jgi:hypothetical protein
MIPVCSCATPSPVPLLPVCKGCGRIIVPPAAPWAAPTFRVTAVRDGALWVEPVNGEGRALFAAIDFGHPGDEVYVEVRLAPDPERDRPDGVRS